VTTVGNALMTEVMIGIDPHKGSHTAVAIGGAEEPLGELRCAPGLLCMPGRTCDLHAAPVVRCRANASNGSSPVRRTPDAFPGVCDFSGRG
jgi:hypothetical protein